jgi:hypothetical protein
MKRIARCGALALALPALLAAQTALTGKWQGKTGGSGQAIVLDVTAKGTALTGTLTVNGETSKIAEGKVCRRTPLPSGRQWKAGRMKGSPAKSVPIRSASGLIASEPIAPSS